MASLPETQRAVQLVGPDQLVLNEGKPVTSPGPYHVLCRVVVVGLCFSDLKLLKQFDRHVRKSEVLSGIDPEVLKELPSYVPGDRPTVPGHEPVVEIVAVGERVTHYKPGERYFVQADWRWLKTADSNGAFGYNFEGALQEYVLLDERILISPEGESMLLPASDPARGMSAYGLVEPWACVEDAYNARERQGLAPQGRMLVVNDNNAPPEVFEEVFRAYGQPASIAWVGAKPEGLPGDTIASVEAAADQGFDDILYTGGNAEAVEALFNKLDAHGLLVIARNGAKFGRDIVTALGRIHYGAIRVVGTAGDRLLEALRRVPPSGEIREGDAINVVGAGGPMGVMHVMRNLCKGVPGVSVYAGDLSDERLAALSRFAEPAARERGLKYVAYNAKTDAPDIAYDCIAIMAPVPALVAQSVKQANPKGRINIFAGIPANVSGPIDLDAYVEKGLYFVGTSGSTMEDMKIVLANVESGALDTNVSVAAISGLDGAIEGIRLVEQQAVPGKIMVYPACKGLGVVRLSELSEKLPHVASHLDNGVWTPAAEQALLSGVLAG